MPLSLNEIKDRALAFSREWEGEQVERAEAQSFWNDFFTVFGISRRRIASFEEPVKKALPLFEKNTPKGSGRIDLFWRGVLIAEHKSLGRDLDTAYKQALGYFSGLFERDLPRYVIVSDFARFRLYDLDKNVQTEFLLRDLYKHIKLFGFISGYTTQKIESHDPVNIKAAERMGKLHDRLRANGYSGHQLEMLLVRLLFCLFADDTTLFEPRGSFRDFIENATKEDGSDLGSQLTMLFQVLNMPEEKRQKNLDELLVVFPYVNGKLFEETLPIAACDRAMRDLLLDCCGLDWGLISPAIFGALFQCVMDEEGTARRRNLGAHYTSEENILKLIKPLFLDALWEEFETAKRSANKLFELHKKLARLKFFDPACGCGNFLVIAYRELRKLELEILRAVRQTGQQHLNIFQLVQVDVDQFFGIEIEEFPAQIAQVALWLTDHQMNMQVSEEFGQYFRRLPLIHSAKIACGNALRMDWNDVVSAEQVDYILGNPPFVGKHYQNAGQKEDLGLIFSGVKGAGVLDYVTAWYLKTVQYLHGNDKAAGLLDGLFGKTEGPGDRVKVAFVSTNSITQGEQVGVLWSELLRLGVRIHFAHRTFSWSNEARGNAAVHCVIIGFGLHDTDRKTIFEYDSPNGEPHAIAAANINPYLVNAADILVGKRSKPICDVPEMGYGSKPADGGNLILSEAEKTELLTAEPSAEMYLRAYVGADELLYNYRRYCLWLKDVPPAKLRSMPNIVIRLKAVRDMRQNSSDANTKRWAEYPSLFQTDRQPKSDYLAIPEVSSERRNYLPVGFMGSEVIASNKIYTLPNATLYHFGMLSSGMHIAWTRYIAGRLESRYQYSNQIAYNNFPWPDKPTEKQVAAVEQAAQAVLDARASHPESSLADLYDPVAMPPDLRKAHQSLDKAVDAAYGKKTFTSDAERVAFLFDLYHHYTSLLPPPEAKKTRKRK
ncbi:MAG: DNA methyltransferase [Nitrospirae bacterium]|nr:MAG: DNA methyltransferase [Nitrospirota bacterium]